MKITLGTNQNLLVWADGQAIAAIASPATKEKIQTAIQDHLAAEEVSVLDDKEIDFSQSFEYTENIDVEVDGEDLYTIELTAITVY